MIGRSDPPHIQSYNRGLEGLIVGSTDISRLDGSEGKLYYRSYDVEDLARHCCFEEVSYLILHGSLPNAVKLEEWRSELVQWRNPPKEAFAALDRIPGDAHPLAQYRTMLTVAACHIPEPENTHLDAQWRRPARILSWASSLAAAAIRHLEGLPPLQPRDDLPFAQHILYQSLGRVPSEMETKAFEASLIVQAEHGLHAAAFAALVVISTGADLGSAVLAGMGALSGVRHGGANQLSFEMLRRLEGPDHAHAWVKEKVREGFRFPGFGHRVYKCPDPRVRALEPHASALLKAKGLEGMWDTYSALRETVESELGGKGIYANVDSITGLVYHPLGLPASAFPIPFCLAIQTGWMAHCLEYLPGGAMIEPGSVYLADR
ncbi:MAG: citrate/2-methylcitrate synthase [bacterium]